MSYASAFDDEQDPEAEPESEADPGLTEDTVGSSPAQLTPPSSAQGAARHLSQSSVTSVESDASEPATTVATAEATAERVDDIADQGGSDEGKEEGGEEIRAIDEAAAAAEGERAKKEVDVRSKLVSDSYFFYQGWSRNNVVRYHSRQCCNIGWTRNSYCYVSCLVIHLCELKASCLLL